ncbi:hypothetical protein Tco_0579324 [Tanacetum coccineum]
MTIPFFAMENANPPPNNCPVLTAALHARAVQELHELQIVSAFVNSHLESIEQFLNNFANQPNETHMNNLESNDESVDILLVSPFPHSDNDLNDGEVLNELIEYENVGMLRRKRAINSSFTYIMDFVVLEDIGEFILINKAKVVMGKPFRKITKLEYDCAKGLMSFNRIMDNYIFRMPHTILRFKRWGHISWSKIPPILVLSERDLTNRFKNAYEKNKFMYKNCLNQGPECQVDESMKEWLIRGHCMIRSSTKELLSPFKNPEQKFCSRGRLFDTPSLVELNSPEFDHNFDIEEQSEEEVRETMTETMEQYMSKNRGDYGSGVTRPSINQDTHFVLKGQFLKELCDNTFSGSEHEDANKHIEKVLEIVDLFHIPKITQDQIML